jgi:PAS domain S-box-containing protein
MSESTRPDDGPVADDCRLKALRRYQILDTEPEPAFDRITRLASHLFDAPVAIVNFVAADRQWFKSRVGIETRETDLDVSFCVDPVCSGDPLVVEDLTADERFADNPFVVEHGFRAYAGVPLTTPDGYQLGTLCVLDTEPRSPSAEMIDRLADLAAMVVDELELRRENAERARAAAKLRRGQELLAQTQRIAQVGGWSYDVRTETLSWTDETYRLHGLSPDASIDVEDAIGFYVPDDRPTIREHVRMLLEEGEHYDLELQIETVDGERRWIRTVGEAHREQGETVRLSGAIQDVTERRRTHEALRSRNEMLQTIIDNIPVTVALFDREGELEIVNTQFEETFGWSQAAVEREAEFFAQLYPDPDVRREARTFIEKAEGTWREFQVRCRGGETRPILASVVSLADGRSIGIGVDLSEKKTRQKQLRLLRAAVEHTRLPILITEAALDPPGPKIVYANRAFVDVTGYEKDEVYGRSPRFLQGDETDQAALDRIRRALEQDEPVREVVRNYRKDGTPYWNDIYITPVPTDDGEITHYVSIQDDVTERIRRREELREAKEAAEEADRVKTALLANMNHEFRTPLTSIISFSELISRTPDLADRFADRILGGGKRLLRTLNAVMDLADLESGNGTVTPQPVKLGDVAATVVDDVRDRAQKDGLSLQVDSPDGPVVVQADRYFVKRTLTHVVDNAVKFTDEGSVTVTVRARGDGGEIRVSDTGIGMTYAEQARAFDEFYQASTGTDRNHEGNGIGLTVAKRMVDRMGGTIEIESTLGEGTDVTVRLPGSRAS